LVRWWERRERERGRVGVRGRAWGMMCVGDALRS